MNHAIEIKNISKSYKDTLALDNINIKVNKGEIFGLLGPDGAGKTTLIRILVTLILPDEGSASLCNFDVVKDYKKIRETVGYMPGRFSLYQDLTVEENMNLFATIFGTTIEENYHLVKDIYSQIEPFKNRRAGKLSGGMKQKLALSCSLIHKPQILLLDEPTTGVDPVSRKELWDMLKKLKNDGITIFVSTPYMDEASLCDRVALIQNGKILDVDTPQAITDAFPYKILAIHSEDNYKTILELREYEFTRSVHPFGDKIHYIDRRQNYDASDIYIYLSKKGYKNITIEETQPTIEDCFMNYMVGVQNEKTA